MSGFYTEKNLIESPNGDILLTIKEDHTAIAENNKIISEDTGGWNENRSSRLAMRIPAQEYFHWIDITGSPECWDDPDFQKFFQRHRPEFCIKGQYMASSTLFNLVNSVLRLSGDLNDITDTGGTSDVHDAAGGVGRRITEMLNLVITKIEREGNWAALREDSFGTTDGVNDTYEFIGAADARGSGTVAVWVSGYGRLDEVTAEQFAKLVAEGGVAASTPLYFQRQLSAAGNLQIQMYPLPAANLTVNVSAYRKATKFSTNPAVDTETTEFDDDILVTGALMHLDLYDGLQRGYDVLFKDALNMMKLESMSNKHIRIEFEDYR